MEQNHPPTRNLTPQNADKVQNPHVVNTYTSTSTHSHQNFEKYNKQQECKEPINSSQRLKVIYTNIDVMTKEKKAELEAEITNCKPDVICLNEVAPKNYIYELTDEHMNIDGYYIIHKDLKGRGTCIYFANHLIASQITLNSDFKESVWCEIVINSEKILLGCIYRSPSSTPDNNTALLQELEQACAKAHDHLIIVGDFNFKEIDWANMTVHASDSHPASLIYDKINDLFLHQHILEPTRFRQGDNPSLLDWVLTNDENTIDDLNISPPLGSSDHVVLSFDVNISSNNTNQNSGYAFYKGNYEEMRKELNSINWESKFEGKTTQTCWTSFYTSLSGMIERHIPKKKYTTRKNPWYNRDIDKARKEKKHAWKKYFKNKSPELWSAYTLKRNELTKLINNSKQKYEDKLIMDIKSNPKNLWSYVKRQTKSKNGISCLENEEGNLIVSDIEKAEILNDFFSSVFTEESFENFPEESPSKKPHCVINNIEINQAKVEKLINKLQESKAAGPDGLHAKILKECSDSTSVALNIIFNKSLSEGVLPREWKEAHVKPLFKKGSKKKPGNYRPVSLTSICCKMMERLVRNDIVSYLEENGFLHNDQHGFREGRSCQSQLLEIMELWTSWLDRGLAWDTIYLDFSKAFDSVPHQRLLLKIKQMGIKGDLLKWISSFLSERKQRVVVGENMSSWAKVKSGIPQGSVLGPILFIIFINDLPDNVKKSLLKIFADDTKLFKTISQIKDQRELQEDLIALAAWSKKWQLPFNEIKFKLMHYGKNNPHFDYKMNGIILAKDDKEKDIGVTFDSDLKFQTHYNNMTAKANSRVGIIKRTFSSLNKHNFPILYKSLVRPLLEYCSPIWNPILVKDINELEKVQQRATKLVKGLKDLPYEQRLRTLGLPTLIYRRKRADMIEVYKILNGFTNINKDTFFDYNNRVGSRGHSHQLLKPRANTRIRQNTFSHRVINVWNSLPEEVVSADSINSFKNRLNTFWKDDLGKFDSNIVTYF